MADPIGIVGVIGVATQVINLVLKLGLDWKEAPADAKRFQNELQILKTVLSETNTNVLLNPDFASAFRGQHSALLSQLRTAVRETDTKRILSACKNELTSLLDELEKRSKGHRVGWERLKSAFLARHTREAVEDLNRRCCFLDDLVAIDSVALAARTYNEVAKVRKEQQVVRIDTLRREEAEERVKLLEWLTPVDYTSRQNDFRRQRQECTGNWFLVSKEYREWILSQGQILYCPGIPGAGKTILMSTIVDDLKVLYEGDTSVGIAYLYCSFKQQDDQTTDSLLLSLLKQLSAAQLSIPTEVTALYYKHKETQMRPSLNEIVKVLECTCASYSKAFVLVDALDEYRVSDDDQANFITAITDLQQRVDLNLLATSRYKSGISERFQKCLTKEIRAADRDVEMYLEHRLKTFSGCIKDDPILQNEIKVAIVKVVDGMFLLARLYLDSLRGKKALKAVRQSLKLFSSGSSAYDNAYQDAMTRIERQHPEEAILAKTALSWIVYARRPLHMREFEHAQAVEIGEDHFDEENLVPVNDIISLCAGLVVVDEESNIIRLVHYTTQEYFQRTGSWWFQDAEELITKTCLTYLSYRSFESGSCKSIKELAPRLLCYPFYEYSANYWGIHASNALKETIWEVLKFLSDEQKVSASIQALVPRNRFDTVLSRLGPMKGFGVHLAAYFGLSAVIMQLREEGYRLDSRDSNGSTPLCWAANYGQSTVVEYLLSIGQVKVGLRAYDDRFVERSLSLAVGGGHEAVVKILLETTNVGINFPTNQSDLTLLSLAAKRGHTPVVKLLLATGQAQINYKDACHRHTALSLASLHGHTAVVRVLLDTDKVDINTRNICSETPLFLAAEFGHTAIVRLLIETGKAEVDIYNVNDNTPLSIAAINGHEEVANVLLNSGLANVNSTDEYGQTLLMKASKEGRESVVKLLLGATETQIDKEDVDGRTAAAWAEKYGHHGIVKLLKTSMKA